MTTATKPFAAVFPGQGSQSVGMMNSFEHTAVVRECFAEASEALGQDLWQLVAEGPTEALASTVNTQPVMLTAGVAVWRAWLAAGGAKPAVVAGHSLGEYAALVAAGVLNFADAVKLVRFRAQAMQEAVPAGEGGMAAILNLSPEDVVAACAEAAQGQIVSPANLNSPVQIVIAGHAAAVQRAMEACKARGAKRAVPLPVSAPFHCALMQPAADRLAEKLASVSFAAPQIPVLNNVDVKVETSAEAIRTALVRQAFSPVRWIEIVQAMVAQPLDTVIEFGPGKVLAGLVKRIAPEVTAEAVVDSDSLTRVLALA
ncbi:ACP S-malonyltransferase [Uliginosibacterium gangwonense]|uniref:ACP S-malonyltransferase n=1 Tax=Uliginosibacterium gangwonense TaxID=392736 RepID=UPI00037773B2|nr:ACP S-malonyltransferase [Uliginosibacterium gangwonense]